MTSYNLTRGVQGVNGSIVVNSTFTTNIAVSWAIYPANNALYGKTGTMTLVPGNNTIPFTFSASNTANFALGNNYFSLDIYASSNNAHLLGIDISNPYLVVSDAVVGAITFQSLTINVG